jgi:large subunit ribosomal protein L32e
MVKRFIRKDANKKKRISGTGWRKPKGITNKKRLNRKGHSPNVRPGYRSPITERNFVNGLEIVYVNTLSALKGVDPKSECVVIGRVGKQKKLDLINEAKNLKLKIVNLDTSKFENNVKEFFDERAKMSKEKLEAQKKRDEELKKKEAKAIDDKKQAEKKEEVKELSDEEKQKLEKIEKDKILTKK